MRPMPSLLTRRRFELAPEDVNVRLNLANAYLMMGSNAAVIEVCQQTLQLDHNSAAAYYLHGPCVVAHGPAGSGGPGL